MTTVKKLDSGLIVFGSRKVAYDNGTTIYIENTARRDFDHEDNVAFDALVYADAKKPKAYVTSLSSAFDWKTQYGNFMKGEFPVGVTFTQDELKVLSVLKDVEAKIKAAFELPSIPYAPVPGVDLKKVFPSASDTKLIEASAWLNGEGNSPSAVPSLLRNSNTIFLRLHKTAGGTQFIYSSKSTGYQPYKIGVKTFTKVFNDFLKPYWAGERSNAYGPQTSGYSTSASKTEASIGCQRDIPRSEIERIAKQLGLI